ncbi:MAG TPA: hypothetical protein VHF70_08870 [Rubrobacteraceae bacterium]|jgi:hypothetical protein|nr:hypothetical protein [Rubrobacteraceae bacterium]
MPHEIASPIPKNSGTPSVSRVRAFTRATCELNSLAPKEAVTMLTLSTKLIAAVAAFNNASTAVLKRRA